RGGNRVLDNTCVPRKQKLEPSPFWKRLQEAFADQPHWQPLNPNSVATRLHKSQGSVHRWFTGEGLPELDTARFLASQSGVCLDCLLDARAPRFPISRDP